MDQFKAVNDLIGHSTGDAVLRRVAEVLTRLVGPRIVYRIGGDEFTAIVRSSPQQAEQLAQQLVIEIPASVAEIPGVAILHVGASIGVSHLHEPTTDAINAAIMQSGHALRAAKDRGKSRVHVFDSGMEQEYRQKRLIEHRLRTAMDGVVLHYQPILSASTSQVVAFEALARWSEDELGDVVPDVFIEIAEQCGLIIELGDYLLERTLREMGEFGIFERGLSISVNVSPVQLLVPGFGTKVLSMVRRHRICPEQLHIEVTESREVRSMSVAIAALRELADGGVQLTIDDFGKGATSIGYLVNLPVNRVKIDRSLTSGLTLGASSAVVEGIVVMSRGLGLQVTAEGVQTEDQLHLARELGVDCVQGWLFSAGLSPDSLGEYLTQAGDVQARARS